MFSTVEFEMQVGKTRYANLSVQLSQPYGTDYKEPFEVGKIIGYNGSWRLNREKFAEECEQYYRDRIDNAHGSDLRIASADMHSNLFSIPKDVVIGLLPQAEAGTW